VIAEPLGAGGTTEQHEHAPETDAHGDAWYVDRVPLVIGIAGGTGSGKTTVSRSVAQALPSDGVATIEHDYYYRDRPELTPEQRAHLNFDHPDALETELLVEHLIALKSGRSVEVPEYDFVTHRRKTERRTLTPKPVIVVEGILVFVDARLREQLDIKVFVDTDADIRIFRRIRRDMEQRGRSFESIREQYYSTVRPMHQQFVEPSKRWADLIIPEGGNNRVALDLVVAKLRGVVDDARG
jgi:uridine kinase